MSAVPETNAYVPDVILSLHMSTQVFRSHLISAVVMIGLLNSSVLTSAAQSITSCGKGGILLLTKCYSPKLRRLYRRVGVTYGRPIRVVEAFGIANDNIRVEPTEIVLTMKTGIGEDAVAHELMHAILQSEGYPQIFGVGRIIGSEALRDMFNADFDHLIIGRRLLKLGYDQHNGFIKNIESYKVALDRKALPGKNGRALLLITEVNYLLYYHYYVEDPHAEPAILAKFPSLRPYWTHIKSAIEAMLRDPRPETMWNAIVRFFAVMDKLCEDYHADFRLSDLLGMNPVPLKFSDLERSAYMVFRDRIERIDASHLLRRTYMLRENVMVDAQIIGASDEKSCSAELIRTRELLSCRALPSYVITSHKPIVKWY